MKLLAMKDSGDGPLSEIVRDSDDERKHEAAWRESQLEIVGTITIPLVLANLINASVVWLSFKETPADFALSVWLPYAQRLLLRTRFEPTGPAILRSRAR